MSDEKTCHTCFHLKRALVTDLDDLVDELYVIRCNADHDAADYTGANPPDETFYLSLAAMCPDYAERECPNDMPPVPEPTAEMPAAPLVDPEVIGEIPAPEEPKGNWIARISIERAYFDMQIRGFARNDAAKIAQSLGTTGTWDSSIPDTPIFYPPQAIRYVTLLEAPE